MGLLESREQFEGEAKVSAASNPCTFNKLIQIVQMELSEPTPILDVTKRQAVRTAFSLQRVRIQLAIAHAERANAAEIQPPSPKKP